MQVIRGGQQGILRLYLWIDQKVPILRGISCWRDQHYFWIFIDHEQSKVIDHQLPAKSERSQIHWSILWMGSRERIRLPKGILWAFRSSKCDQEVCWAPRKEREYYMVSCQLQGRANEECRRLGCQRCNLGNLQRKGDRPTNSRRFPSFLDLERWGIQCLDWNLVKDLLWQEEQRLWRIRRGWPRIHQLLNQVQRRNVADKHRRQRLYRGRSHQGYPCFRGG